MSSLIKGPLDGAAAVRGPAVAFADPPIFDPIALDAHNASVREHRRCRVARCPLCKHASDKGPLAADLAPLPTVADVEPIAAVMTGTRLPMTPTERAAWLTAGGTAQVLTADVEHDGDRGPRASTDQALGPKRSKPFPMPGTVWRWLGHPDYDPKPSAPKRVESLRWFRGRVEAMFVGGESCAGVEHLMGSDAWEHYPETVPVGRDPLSVLDQAADAQRAAHVGALLSAVAGLRVDEVRVLAAMARQLPGVRLRAACEAATAQGWVRSGATRVDVPSSLLARAQSSLLGTWREWIAVIHGAQSTAARDVAQRDRGDVLADEAARRAGGGE